MADLVGLEAGEAERITWMDCVGCGSVSVTERHEVTAQGYRRFRCRDCGRQFNERSGGVLHRTCLPSDMVVSGLAPAFALLTFGPGRFMLGA